MRSILITGGAGYIGSHTCYLLLESGYEIYIIDSLINSDKKSLERVLQINPLKKEIFKNKLHLFVGDIRDKELLRTIFTKAKINSKPIGGVIHFAGLKAVNDSINNPLIYWENNVQGSITLLKVMAENQCRKIIFSSSATIYGNNNQLKIDENNSLKALNPYGETKIAIENLLRNIYDSSPNKWGIINLRYFNPIGAHESGLIGENPLGTPNNIFPIINLVAQGKNEKLAIYGNDWETHDGTGVRDFIHVCDCAEGHIRALEFLNKQKTTLINLNIGTGKGYSVLDLIKTFEKVNKVSIPYFFAKRREGDCGSVIADNSLAKKILKWEPSLTLEQMCLDGWKWTKINPNGFQ